MVAYKIGTSFTAGPSAVADVASNPTKLAQLTAEFNKMKDAVKSMPAVQAGIENWGKTEAARTLIKQGKVVTFAATNPVYTPEDMIRMAAVVASLVDPTGVSGVIAAYSYSKCSVLVSMGK